MRLYDFGFGFLVAAFLFALFGAWTMNEIDDKKAAEQKAQVEQVLYNPEA